MRRAALGLVSLVGAGCERPTCTPPDYSVSECRVQAENELARGVTVDGVEVRLQDPRGEGSRSWEALGRVTSLGDGRVRVRVATLGDFRLTFHRGGAAVDALVVELDNVHALVAPLAGEIERRGLTRVVEVALTEDVVELRGTLPETACGQGFSLAAVGDIQTGPLTFQRIVEDLHREVADQAAAGTPLLGLLLLGDLAEFGSQVEFDRVAEILAGSPVPIAITPGNHDIYETVQPLFNQSFGPGNYAFDVCDARIVMLDTGNGDLARSVQGWLPRLLGRAGEARYLVAGMHMAPYAGYTTDGWRREDQAQHLLAELAARDADLIVAGHVHWRGVFDQAPVREVIVGTGGASQRGVDPDYGYLRMNFAPGSPSDLDVCFLSLPAPGSPGPPERRAPRLCGP
jgi:hypothetical protein